MDRIVVIIPTYNRKLHLQQVLHNLSNQIIDDIELRILVAIDGSDDGTEEMIKREFPTVNYIKGSGDWWYTKSMNEAFAGVLRLFPDYVLTMNDDVKLSSNYVSELYQSIKKQNQPCIMGSVSVTESLPHQITFSGVRDIKWWRYQQVNYIQPFTVVDVSALKGVQPSKVLPGRGMLIPIRALKELNGFNETLPQYGSDDDFCLRAQKKGFRIYVNYKAVVYSYERLTGAGNPIVKSSLWAFTKSFGNKYSSRYLLKTAKMIVAHGYTSLLPITLVIVIIGSYKSYFKYNR